MCAVLFCAAAFFCFAGAQFHGFRLASVQGPLRQTSRAEMGRSGGRMFRTATVGNFSTGCDTPCRVGRSIVEDDGWKHEHRGFGMSRQKQNIAALNACGTAVSGDESCFMLCRSHCHCTLGPRVWTPASRVCELVSKQTRKHCNTMHNTTTIWSKMITITDFFEIDKIRNHCFFFFADQRFLK